jgi:Tol biopolymer transport system component
VVLLGLLAVGCAARSTVRLSELPAASLALVYRTPDEARQRAERLRELRTGREARRGIAHIADLERLLGRTDAGSTGEGRLALLDPRRGEATPLPELPRGAMPLAWSADRQGLLFSAPAHGRRQLFELHVPSRELRPLTHGPRRHPMGCYFADGRLAVVEAIQKAEGLEMRIWVTREGGGAPRRLTEGPLDVFPACSPDGRLVAFTKHRRDRPERIVVVDLRSREAKEIATGTHSAFTPSGEWIVYSARTRRGFRLWRVRPDGSGRAPIGARWGHEGDEATPTVSPDGRFVVYVLKEEDRDRLRLRRMDGEGDRPLLEHGDGTVPVW